MGFDASPFNRWGMDYSLASTSISAVSPYSAYIIKIVNDQVDITDTDADRVVTESRILIADGHRWYAPGDGYLNPILEQEDGQQLIISNGQLTTTRLILGPLVFPYTTYFVSGGTDVNLFQPQIGSNNNVQVYVQVRGPGLSLKSNYFVVDRIMTEDMTGLSYKVLLISNTSVVI